MGSALQGARVSAVSDGVSPRSEKNLMNGGRTSPSLSSATAVRCGSERVSGSGGPPLKPTSIAEMTLLEMGPAELAQWLRQQRFPENVEVDALCSSLESKGVRGDQLADYTNRELRDVVGIQQLAWRKAVLRNVREELAREKQKALAPENDPSAMSLSGSFKFSFKAYAAAQSQSFTVRKSSAQLTPLGPSDDNVTTPRDAEPGAAAAARQTWPLKPTRRSRISFGRRASPAPSPERSSGDPATDEPESLSIKIRRSFSRTSRSPSPTRAPVVARADPVADPVPLATVEPVTPTVLEHDTPREVEPEPEPRRRRLF